MSFTFTDVERSIHNHFRTNLSQYAFRQLKADVKGKDVWFECALEGPVFERLNGCDIQHYILNLDFSIRTKVNGKQTNIYLPREVTYEAYKIMGNIPILNEEGEHVKCLLLDDIYFSGFGNTQNTSDIIQPKCTAYYSVET